jgi:hypothetical protein
VKMTATAHEAGTNRADPAIKMPPRLRPIVLQRRKIPKSAKRLDPSVAGISGDQGRRYCAGRRARQPMHSDRSFPKGLVSAGMVSGQPKASAKRHRNRL